MIANDAQKTQFAEHYQQLEIDDRANWDSAQSSYRKLVHVWHPDKFTSRPRERLHAQQRFINLTKSYNALRDFYRTNQRLPFQSVHTASKDQKPKLEHDSQEPKRSASVAEVDSSVLRRDPEKSAYSTGNSGNRRKIIWALAGLSILFFTATLFLILDQKLNQATAEIGREVIKDAPESEFLLNNTEIRRSQTRGAFVKPTQ
ncbi:MAG: J domain-containing protein [Granulosicoccus sp.]